MRPRSSITVVGCHAGGEVGNVVVAGVEPPAGATVFEQMQALRADDSLRRLLLREPRGSVATHANLIVPATRQDCDFGYIIMEPTEYPAMSGSNTICVATVLLETGNGRAAGAGDDAEARGARRPRRGHRRVPRRTGRERRAHERPLLRRPPRCAPRSRWAGHPQRGRRVRRDVVRDRRRGSARLRPRAGRSARAFARRRADPRRRRASSCRACTRRTPRSPA